MLSAVPWTSTTGYGWAAFGVQGWFAPGGGGVAAATGPAPSATTRAASGATRTPGGNGMRGNSPPAPPGMPGCSDRASRNARQRTIEDVFRWAEHTGELELEIEAASEHGVYEDAVRAMGELLGGDRPPRGQA